MYIVDVYYLDEYNSLQSHKIENPGFLIYKNLLDKPTIVDRIAREGVVMGRNGDGSNITRHGTFIPPTRIVRIFWEDDLDKTENERSTEEDSAG